MRDTMPLLADFLEYLRNIDGARLLANRGQILALQALRLSEQCRIGVFDDYS